MHQMQLMPDQPLAVGTAADIGIELMKGIGELTDGAAAFVLAHIVVIEDRNHTGAAVELPQRTFGRSNDPGGKLINDERAYGPAG